MVTQKKVAIYIRCSSEESAKKGFSVSAQEEKLKEFVKANDYTLSEKHVYKDEALSGISMDRPGLQRLLQDAENKEFEIVLVYRLDRFFRKTRYLLDMVEKLANKGVAFKSITESFDTSTSMGRYMLTNLGAIAEMERETIMERKELGTIKALQQGIWIGGAPPYGYDIENKKLIINKKEAKIIKILFGWLIDERFTLYKIQSRINSLGILTKHHLRKKKNKPTWWATRTLGRILSNEIYTGEICIRKYKKPARVQSPENLRPKDDWIKLETPLIIPKDRFQLAQQQLKLNREFSKRNTKTEYMLSKLIKCGMCGSKYVACSSKNSKIYVCSHRRKSITSERCMAPAVTSKRIEPAVWGKVTQLLKTPEIVMGELKRYINKNKNYNEVRDKLNFVTKSLEKYHVKEKRLVELYVEEGIDKSYYDVKKQKLDEEKDRLFKEKYELDQVMLSKEVKSDRSRSIKEYFKQLVGRLSRVTYSEQCKIIKLLVDKVTVIRDSLEIECVLPIGKPVEDNNVALWDNRRIH